MIVLADADLERAANGAVWGGMFNTGQACTSVERVYVEEPVYDRFVALVAERVRALRQGTDGKGFDADVGALSSETQLGIVERHVRGAGEGGTCKSSVARARTYREVLQATVLVDVDQSMSCMREETFGPTLPVMKVQTWTRRSGSRTTRATGFRPASGLGTAPAASGSLGAWRRVR